MSGPFAIGEAVRVKALYPADGHVRTPYYIRGVTGVIADSLGAFPNPEQLALWESGEPVKHLYRVRFKQTDAWPDYAEDPKDTVDIEIYEHWLEPAGG